MPFFSTVRIQQEFKNLLQSTGKSKSQHFQDLYALASSGFRSGGFFVEFGATNGIKHSNTYLLEKSFGWNGILSEPAKCWHSSLYANRSCIIDNRCVWSTSGAQLEFVESASPSLSGVFQTLKFRRASKSGKPLLYSVPTVSLNDLLLEHNAPSVIDYMSVDTEGSEYKILSQFDFSRYCIKALSVEHNFTSDRKKLKSLLESWGFSRVHMTLSGCDDWYVRDS